MTRKKIFLIWLFGSILIMVLASSISMVIWNFTYDPPPTTDWQPIAHVWNMILLVPIGWLLSFMTFFGWVSIFFLCMSMFKKWPWLLLGSAVATLATGAWWPMIYTTMLNN
jgi:uncharacterized BrkB/YihY/UPF0761 family membrane protein